MVVESIPGLPCHCSLTDDAAAADCTEQTRQPSRAPSPPPAPSNRASFIPFPRRRRRRRLWCAYSNVAGNLFGRNRTLVHSLLLLILYAPFIEYNINRIIIPALCTQNRFPRTSRSSFVVLLPSLHNQQQRGGTEEDATQERSIIFRCCSLFSQGKRHGIGSSKNDDEVV